MTPEAREQFAHELRERLNSRRDVFVVDEYMFEPYSGVSLAMSGRRRIAVAGSGSFPPEELRTQKTISSACLRLLLDYCESAWEMSLPEYCAGVFHGREAREGETAFDLLPTVQERLSADRLGLGGIYGTGDKP